MAINAKMSRGIDTLNAKVSRGIDTLGPYIKVAFRGSEGSEVTMLSPPPRDCNTDPRHVIDDTWIIDMKIKSIYAWEMRAIAMRMLWVPIEFWMTAHLREVCKKLRVLAKLHNPTGGNIVHSDTVYMLDLKDDLANQEFY